MLKDLDNRSDPKPASADETTDSQAILSFVPRLTVRESISDSVGIVRLDRLDVIESAVVTWQ